MNLTELEHLEFTEVDVPIECDGKECTARAVLAVRTYCCPILVCVPCKDEFIAWLERYLPAEAGCRDHPDFKKFCDVVSDLIISVDPL